MRGAAPGGGRGGVAAMASATCGGSAAPPRAVMFSAAEAGDESPPPLPPTPMLALRGVVARLTAIPSSSLLGVFAAAEMRGAYCAAESAVEEDCVGSGCSDVGKGRRAERGVSGVSCTASTPVIAAAATTPTRSSVRVSVAVFVRTLSPRRGD